MNFLYPVPKSSWLTQTYDEHVQRAKAHGWAWKPGMAGDVKYYGGIDWGVSQGTPILLAQAGEIVEVRFDNFGYGWHVRAKHEGGYLSIYAHLSQIFVKVGDKLKAGHVIGKSGNTGYSTGPHLHFELRKDGIPIDPAPLLVTSLVESDPPPADPADNAVVVLAKWNLRDGPNGLDIGTADADIQAVMVKRDGDWVCVRMEVWVHKDGVA